MVDSDIMDLVFLYYSNKYRLEITKQLRFSVKLLKGRGLLYLELSQFMLYKCSMYNEIMLRYQSKSWNRYAYQIIYDCLENLKPRGPSPLSAGLLLSFAVARSISKKIHKSN